MRIVVCVLFMIRNESLIYELKHRSTAVLCVEVANLGIVAAAMHHLVVHVGAFSHSPADMYRRVGVPGVRPLKRVVSLVVALGVGRPSLHRRAA